jgi:hypothetical protein
MHYYEYFRLLFVCLATTFGLGQISFTVHTFLVVYTYRGVLGILAFPRIWGLCNSHY